jgi:DNA-binding NtrC family response regulator
MARLLVVDDDAGVRELLVELLGAMGHEVREADSGAAALRAVAEDVPDAVCLDLWMDGMSGLDVLDRLTREHPGLPVVIVTADPFTDTMDTARARGAFDYILKPFEAARIQRIVDAAVSGRPGWLPR